MKKAKSYIWISFTAIICFEFLISPAMAATDLSDVMALEDLYRTLGYPPQLIGWSLDGGDPCLESWTGISCNGTSVRLINLAGLDLGGTLGWQLNLPNLWQLDLSFNHIQGAIPGSLPINITYIDLSSNKFSMNIPYSLASMKHLSHLNLSHNSLSGPISNLFADLHSLKQIDLSYNSFTGDIPSSFGNLTNLTALYLEHNNFNGSFVSLEKLQFTKLNIQNNNFSNGTTNHLQEDGILTIFVFGGLVLAAIFSAIMVMRTRGIVVPPIANQRGTHVTVCYKCCDGLSQNSVKMDILKVETYFDFVEVAAQLVYGPFIGKAIHMELAAEHLLTDLDQHQQLFHVGGYSLKMSWRGGDGKLRRLSENINWVLFQVTVEVIHLEPLFLRPGSLTMPIIVPDWFAWPTSLPRPLVASRP